MYSISSYRSTRDSVTTTDRGQTDNRCLLPATGTRVALRIAASLYLSISLGLQRSDVTSPRRLSALGVERV